MASTTNTTNLAPNVAAALSYVLGPITGIVFLLISQDKFVRFHAMQSTITFIGFFVINFVLSLIGLYMLTPLIGLVAFILWIVLIIKAYQNEKFKLPIIGDFAEQK